MHGAWCATTRRQHQLPTTPLLIDGCSVTPVSTVRDLGIYINSDLSMRSQVKHTLLRCFASLWFVDVYCQPLFRWWWLPWYTPDWTTGTMYWSAFRLPDALTPVSPQCSCATDLRSEIQWPYYWCANQPSLVAGSRADPVQARCHGVQSATWTCTKLSRATCPRRRCVWSSSTPLRRHELHPGAASHVHHHRQSSLPSRYLTNLELSTRQRYLRWVAANFPEKAEKTSILSVFSWLWLLTFTPAVDLAVAVPLRPL